MARKIVCPGPLQLGQQQNLIQTTTTGPGSVRLELKVVSETVLFSLQARVVSGTLNVRVLTRGSQEPEEGNSLQVAEFPELNAPTSALLIRKAASTMEFVIVEVEYTGIVEYSINARGVSSAEASFRLLGDNNLRVSQITASTTPAVLIPASLTDRSSLIIRNFDSVNTLFIGESSLVAVPATGMPILPFESYQADLAAGQDLFGSSDAGTIDVRIAESGGGI